MLLLQLLEHHNFLTFQGKVFRQSPIKSTKVKIGRRINLWIVTKPEDEII